MMENLTCKRCGAEYEVTAHEVATSELAIFQCDCGQTLMRGDEVTFYTFKLIKLGEEPESSEKSI